MRCVAPLRPIDVPTVFRDFDDYWQPFLGKQGAAPTYLAGLDAAAREGIREALRARLVAADDGSIAMSARAWTVQGSVGLLANSSYAATGVPTAVGRQLDSRSFACGLGDRVSLV